MSRSFKTSLAHGIWVGIVSTSWYMVPPLRGVEVSGLIADRVDNVFQTLLVVQLPRCV